jgi:hypothetical protein
MPRGIFTVLKDIQFEEFRKDAFATPPSPTLTHFIPGVSAGRASGIKACCENLPSGIVSGKNVIVGLMRALGGE